MREEFVDPHKRSLDESDDGEMLDEVGLRPRSLSDFVGQRELKEHLSIVLEAARRRGQAADHLLFAGPPGLGKTTLAGIVATNDHGALTLVSGVGRKTADRLLIELKGRMNLPIMDTPQGEQSQGHRAVTDVREALTGLGYSNEEIRDVLRELSATDTAENMLRQALNALGVKRA